MVKMDTSKEMPQTKEKIRKKKKERKSGIDVHDINLMNKKELRYYISRLEEELKQIRIDCNASSDVNNKFLSFVDQVQGICLEKEQLLTTKNFKVDNTIKEFENKLKNFRIKNEYKKLRKHEQQSLQLFTGFLDKSSDKILKNKFGRKQNAERFSAVESLLSEIITMDMIACDLFGNYKNWSKELSFEHILKCREAMHKFNAIKLRILNSIWELDFSDEEPISVEIEKLQFYFNELHEDNLKALQNWREKVMLLQDELEKVFTDLNKALLLNEDLKKQYSTLNPEMFNSKRAGLNKEFCVKELTNPGIDDTAIKNLELKSKLKTVKEERLKVKNKLLADVRKIYRIAEFKSFVAEEIIRLGLAMKEAESCNGKDNPSQLEMKNNVELKQKSQNNYKFLKMNSARNNTLFVPPIF